MTEKQDCNCSGMSELWEGCGCFMIVLAIGLALNFDRILDIIEKALTKP